MINILLVGLIGYGYYNLKSNSVYYAKKTPHKEGTEPVLMMLVDNLAWIYKPEIKEIKYEGEGKSTIKIYSDKKNQAGFLTTANKNGKKGYLFDNIKARTIVEFDSGFNAIKMYNTSESIQEIDFTKK